MTDQSDLVLSIDLGTSSCKAVLVDAAGRVALRASRGYPTMRPEPGQAEQDPDRILAAAAGAVREAADACAGQPSCVVLSSAMHSLLALGPDGAPLTPLFTWADGRGAAEARELRRDGSATALQERTGTPVHASSPLCKLRWLSRHRAPLFESAAAFVSMKEYLLRRFVGQDVVDRSVASATGLFSLRTGTWDPAALELAQVGAERLSRLVPTRHVLRGSWRPEVLAELGLSPAVPLVVGATDGVLANLGVGVDGAPFRGESDDGAGGLLVAVTMGTSAAARITVDRPGVPASSGLFCYVLDDDRWVAGGAINNAGLVLDWLGRELFPHAPDPVERVLAEAAESPPGANGLVCIPRLSGERFPDYDAEQRGSFVGLSIEHRRCDLVRAALEGVVVAVAGIVAELERHYGAAAEVRAGGGLLRSPLLAQMLADATGRPVSVPESLEASAIGAALLARRALGQEQNLRAPLDPGACYRAKPELTRLYDRLRRSVTLAGGAAASRRTAK